MQIEHLLKNKLLTIVNKKTRRKKTFLTIKFCAKLKKNKK